MSGIALLQDFARYNRWVNEKIYSVCAEISDAERKRDLGAFFSSIHRTLNHLLLTDRVWLGRLKAIEFPVKTLGDELYGDFNELVRQRVITDNEWIDFLAGLSDGELRNDLTYTSVSTGVTRSYPLHHVLLHIGNHQTHHRGQITAMIRQLGFDYGDIDMLFMPR